MRKYAIIKENIIIDVQDLEDDQVQAVSELYQNVIDVQDSIPQPQVGWQLIGNKLHPNYSNLTPDEVDRLRMKARFVFGNKLCDEAIEMISVRNRALGKTATQVNTLIQAFMPLEMALRKCALPTALGGLTIMAAGYPEYTQEFGYIISSITSFLTAEATVQAQGGV